MQSGVKEGKKEEEEEEGEGGLLLLSSLCEALHWAFLGSKVKAKRGPDGNASSR